MAETNEAPAAQAAPETTSETPSKAPSTLTGFGKGTSEKSVSSPESSDQASATQDAANGQAGQNATPDYTALKELYEKQQKSYNELRGKLVTQGTERNQFSSKVDQLTAQVKQLGEALAKATQQPYDPDAFMEELRTQGPKAIENHIKGTLDKQAQQYQGQVQELQTKMRHMDVAFQVKERRVDSKNYPDFTAMEETMAKVMEQLRDDYKAGLIGDPDGVEPGELVDFLYNQAKLQHSQDAIKAAEAHGAAKAKAELVNEANTAVASGGKNAGTSVINPNEIKDMAALRKWAVQKFGESAD